MAYAKLPGDDVKQWEADYKQLKTDLEQASDATRQAELTAAMQSVGVKVEERLNAVAKTIKGYSKQRHQLADKLTAQALAELKQARAKAAAFKKKPGKTNLENDLKDSIQHIQDFEKRFRDDGQEYGAAWFEYRSAVASKLPEKYARSFNAVQGTIVNDDKHLGAQLEQIVAARHQAEALLAITAKAAMKASIKSGTGTQRDILLAQQDARALAAQMAGLLQLLLHPNDASTPPDGITSGRGTLEGVFKDNKFWSSPAGMKTARSIWSNVQIANKNMNTKLANMEQVLATRARGFRAKELADATVAAEMTHAKASLKAARKEVKQRAPDYAGAKTAMDKLEAEAKKRKIK